MRKAGLNTHQLLTGQSHAMHVVDARDGKLPRPAFHAYRADAGAAAAPAMSSARRAGETSTSRTCPRLSIGTTPMHCDIVVAWDPLPRVVRAIGGNVQQSVTMSEIDLNDAGQLDALRQLAHAVAAGDAERFAVMGRITWN